MKPQTRALVITKSVLTLVVATLILVISVSAQNTAPLDTKDTDIRELLSTLAKTNGINLILGDSVIGTVSISLSGVSTEEAMRLILSGTHVSSHHLE